MGSPTGGFAGTEIPAAAPATPVIQVLGAPLSRPPSSCSGYAPRSQTARPALGHSQVTLTLNTYSHVIPSLGRDSASPETDSRSGVRRKRDHAANRVRHDHGHGASRKRYRASSWVTGDAPLGGEMPRRMRRLRLPGRGPRCRVYSGIGHLSRARFPVDVSIWARPVRSWDERRDALA